MDEITIPLSDNKRLAEVCAELTKNCVRYQAQIVGDNWKIQISGF